MKLVMSFRQNRGTRAFTMIEIAISVAVIAFALVAIIGVLPAGLQVQKENREDTLLAQDGTYFMQAIRNGAYGLDELTNYVSSIEINGTGYSNFTRGAEVIGLLSTPGTTNVATVRAISGALAEKGPATADVAFRYELQVQIAPFESMPNTTTNTVLEDQILRSKLHEIRMLFRWPILPNRNVGNGRQILRSLVSGDFATETNNNNNAVYFFLRP
jgi:type II secretory pathway pseudopilin PulG